MDQSPVILWQMPRLWGLPNPSPFCMKVETWLRMAGLPYEAKAITGPPKSASGKVPYIERPDGSLLSDSSLIIETLTKERGVSLDDHLSPDQRATALLMQRTLEESLYFAVLHDRWVDDAGWSITRTGYFAPFPWVVRTLVVPIVRRKIIAAAKGQGVARLSNDYRRRKGVADVNAIARLLGDKPFFCGEPSTADAILHAFVANALQAPIGGPVPDAVAQHENLVAHCTRMKNRYYADWNG